MTCLRDLRPRHLGLLRCLFVLGCGLGLALALLLPPLASAQKKTTKGYVYIVQPGDSCWSIAENLFGNGKRYDLIHKYNNLGPMPHILRPGQEIYLPVNIPLPDAQIAWLRRSVRTKPPNSIDWYKAKKEMRLWRLYRVTTGQKSAAMIRFEDRSALNLREKSLVVIYGDQGLQKRSSREIKKSIVLEEGTIKGGLSSLYSGSKPPSSIAVQTPASQIELASQSSQVEVDPSKTSIVSVYQGKAQVKAQGTEVTVPEDFGTRVEKGKKPEKPRRLPPRVLWATSERRLAFFVLKGFRATASIRWQSLKEAALYRVEVATDKDFREPLRDLITGSGVTAQEFDELEVGTYYARIAAIDRFKLEGKPSETLQIDVLPLSPAPRLILPRPGAAYEIIGLLKITPPPSPTDYSLDGTPFQPFKEPLRFSKPGTYGLSVRPQGSTETPSQVQIRLLDVKASIHAPQTPLKVGGSATKISVSLRDSQGRPSALQDLRLTAFPGTDLPLQASSQVGDYTADLPAPARYEGEKIYLTLSWTGGDLTRISIPVEPPPRTSLPRPVEPDPRASPASPPAERDLWRSTPIAAQGLRLAPGLAPLSAAPLTYAGLTLSFSEFEATRFTSSLPPSPPPFSLPQGRGWGVRMAARGEIALLAERLGLDIDIPFLQSALVSADATGDSAGSVKLGDISLGVRYAFPFQASGVTLAAGLRFGIPTNGFPRRFSPEKALVLPLRDFNQFLVTGSFLLDWHRGWFSLHNSAALTFSAGGDVGGFLSLSLTAQARPLPLVSFALEAAVLFGFGGSSTAELPLDVSLSAVVRLHLGRFRLGVFGGLAPANIEPKSPTYLWFGAGQVGLTLDVAFPSL